MSDDSVDPSSPEERTARLGEPLTDFKCGEPTIQPSVPAIANVVESTIMTAFFETCYSKGRIYSNGGTILHSDINKVLSRFEDVQIINHDGWASAYVLHAEFGIMLSREGKFYAIHIISTPEKADEVHEKFTDLLTTANKNIDLMNYYVSSRDNSLSTSWVSINIAEYGKYLTDVLHEHINVPELINSFMLSSSKMLILCGAPGTGKSSIVKQIVKRVANEDDDSTTVAYVKDERALKDPKLWVNFASESPPLIVFDDLDNSLKTRSKTSSTQGAQTEISDDSFVNQLLSFSDGVLDTDSKIVITTNQTLEDVDPAVIRHGRTFDVLNIPLMTHVYAKKIWVSHFTIPEEDFDISFSAEDDIMQAHFMAEVNKYRSTAKSYLTDPSISIQSKLINKKSHSIGFM